MGVAIQGVCYSSAAQAANVLCSHWPRINDRTAGGNWFCNGTSGDALVIRNLPTATSTPVDYLNPVTGPACDPFSFAAMLPRVPGGTTALRVTDTQPWASVGLGLSDLETAALAILTGVCLSVVVRTMRLILEKD